MLPDPAGTARLPPPGPGPQRADPGRADRPAREAARRAGVGHRAAHQPHHHHRRVRPAARERLRAQPPGLRHLDVPARRARLHRRGPAARGRGHRDRPGQGGLRTARADAARRPRRDHPAPGRARPHARLSPVRPNGVARRRRRAVHRARPADRARTDPGDLGGPTRAHPRPGPALRSWRPGRGGEPVLSQRPGGHAPRAAAHRIGAGHRHRLGHRDHRVDPASGGAPTGLPDPRLPQPHRPPHARRRPRPGAARRRALRFVASHLRDPDRPRARRPDPAAVRLARRAGRHRTGRHHRLDEQDPLGRIAHRLAARAGAPGHRVGGAARRRRHGRVGAGPAPGSRPAGAGRRTAADPAGADARAARGAHRGPGRADRLGTGRPGVGPRRTHRERRRLSRRPRASSSSGCASPSPCRRTRCARQYTGWPPPSPTACPPPPRRDARTGSRTASPPRVAARPTNNAARRWPGGPVAGPRGVTA